MLPLSTAYWLHKILEFLRVRDWEYWLKMSSKAILWKYEQCHYTQIWKTKIKLKTWPSYLSSSVNFLNVELFYVTDFSDLITFSDGFHSHHVIHCFKNIFTFVINKPTNFISYTGCWLINTCASMSFCCIFAQVMPVIDTYLSNCAKNTFTACIRMRY